MDGKLRQRRSELGSAAKADGWVLGRHAVVGGGAYLGRALPLQRQHFQWGSVHTCPAGASRDMLAGITCLHRAGLHRADVGPRDDDSNPLVGSGAGIEGPGLRRSAGCSTGASSSAEPRAFVIHVFLACSAFTSGLATLPRTRKVENAAECLSAYWPTIPARLSDLPVGPNEDAGPRPGTR